MNDTITVAKTIRQQITLDAWLAVSARHPENDSGDLVFRFGRAGGNKRHIRVHLNALDLYDVTATSTQVRSGPNWMKVTDVARYVNVYADTLAELVRSINHNHG